MNTDNLILRETDNLPLINKDDTLTNAEIDGNFINIYNDFISLSQANDPTLIYDVDRSYLVDEFATYNGRLWIATDISTGVTPVEGSAEWNDVFPTVLAHEKNKDTILDEGGINETTVAEIRAFIDAGLTSTTNLSLSTKTGASFKIESSTGTDVTIPQANSTEAGLLNAEDKVKLDNQSGINTGDQTLASLSGEDVTNKVTDFTTINDTLYPTTQAVDTYITAVVPDLVETFIDGSVELNTNKATTFAIINDTLYPSVKAVDDQLDLKVDKVVGSRLITSAESTLLGNTSGTNTGDQDLSSYATNSSVVKLTGDQTVGGIKTLTNELKLNDKLYLSETAAPAAMTGYTTLTSNGSQFLLQNGSSTAAATFVFSGARTYTLPNITGTLLASTNNLSDLTNTTTARSNLGLGSLATQSGTFSGTSSGTNTGDQTFLNARVQTVTSSATVTPLSTNDLVIITAQAVGLTLANPTGTFTEGQALMIRIKDNGTARTIAFDTNYRAIGVTLPTTTVISKTLYLGIIYNSTDSKWDIVGYNIQA